MYRDMTRGSITRGLLLFALPMAAGARVALAYAPAGRWASTASGPLSLSAGFWRTPWDTATTSSGAERCSLGRERRLIRGIKKSGASPMNCTPFAGQYGILSNKWGVFICQREYHRIKLKLNGLNPVQYRIQTVQAA